MGEFLDVSGGDFGGDFGEISVMNLLFLRIIRGRLLPKMPTTFKRDNIIANAFGRNSGRNYCSNFSRDFCQNFGQNFGRIFDLNF